MGRLLKTHTRSAPAPAPAPAPRFSVGGDAAGAALSPDEVVGASAGDASGASAGDASGDAMGASVGEASGDAAGDSLGVDEAPATPATPAVPLLETDEQKQGSSENSLRATETPFNDSFKKA